MKGPAMSEKINELNKQLQSELEANPERGFDHKKWERVIAWGQEVLALPQDRAMEIHWEQVERLAMSDGMMLNALEKVVVRGLAIGGIKAGGPVGQQRSAADTIAISSMEAMEQLASKPEHWEGWVKAEVSDWMADDWFMSAADDMAQAKEQGYQKPKLVEVKEDKWENEQYQANQEWKKRWLPEWIDKAERAGLLERFKQTGQLRSWAALCAINGNETRLDRAIEAGADFKDQSPEQAWGLMMRMCSSKTEGAMQMWGGWGVASKKEIVAAESWDAEVRAAIWSRLVRAGLPVAKGPELSADAVWRMRWGRSDAKMLREEFDRGGLRDAAGVMALVKLTLGGGAQKWFEGMEPLSYAIKSGLSLPTVSEGAIRNWLIRENNGCEVDAMLKALAEGGVRISGEKKGVFVNGANESLIGTLMHMGASPEGIKSANQIGVSALDRSEAGNRSSLQQLFELGRAGSQKPRLLALLGAAEQEKEGGAKELLAMTGKDGEGPMHWAARSLCAESIAALAERGCDPNAADKKGATAGHWAARKYGAGSAKKVAPALAALSKAGQRWEAMDKKGKTAMAALADKGPIEAIREHLIENLDALNVKAGSAKSASEALVARGRPDALALVEKAALTKEVKGLAAEGEPKAEKKRAKRM